MSFNFSFNMDNAITGKIPFELNKTYDLLVIGAGPAGLNAALYAKRKGLNVAVISKKKGGQILDTSVVDNYLGISSVSGEDLAAKFLEHVAQFEIPILENTDVSGYIPEDMNHALVLSTGDTVKSRTVLVATGARPRKLNVPGEDAYIGKGVSYCAICDGPLFEGLDIFVAGGGNSAVEAALDLAKTANSVTLVHRSELRADKILTEQLYSVQNIKVFLKTKILEILGDKAMDGILVEKEGENEKQILNGKGIFVEIGHIPNTQPFHDVLKLNDRGEIVTNNRKETSISGIFAAGDVTDSLYKQIIISAGEGAVAALAINEYINKIKK